MRRCTYIAALLVLLCWTLGSCKGDATTVVEEKLVLKEVPARCEPCPPCQVPGEVREAPAPAPDDLGPEECVLYHLVDIYEPTVFSHANHVEYDEDCEVCHHHSSEVEKFPPCRECHGIAFKSLDKPGLKGAYHRQCMNCHRQMDSGPLGCQECHKKREPIAVSQEDLARKYVQDTMKLGHLSKDFAEVVFNHKLHVELTAHCEDCHHHHTENEVTPPCRECHNHQKTEEGSKVLGLHDAYHEQCLKCHRASSKKGKKSPLQCTDCHLSKKAPASVELGKLAKKYVPVEFDHEMHTETTDYCTDCHHANTTYDRIVKCDTCHKPGKAEEGKTNLKKAYHDQCINCHKEQDEGPQDCGDCHEEAE